MHKNEQVACKQREGGGGVGGDEGLMGFWAPDAQNLVGMVGFSC